MPGPSMAMKVPPTASTKPTHSTAALPSRLTLIRPETNSHVSLSATNGIVFLYETSSCCCREQQTPIVRLRIFPSHYALTIKVKGILCRVRILE